MKITGLLWDPETVEHKARHSVAPEEVEEMIFSYPAPIIEKGREKGLYLVSGQTGSGRYLLVVIKTLGKGKAKPSTVREMSERDKDHYKRRLR